MLLVADIGGTKVKLATIDISSTALKSCDFRNEKEYSSFEFQSLEEIISAYVKSIKINLTAIALGVAGPVGEGKSKITNLPWKIEINAIKNTFKVSHAFLMNDLEAHAYGISTISQQDLATIQKGNLITGNAAIIAVGTGLGECLLFWNGSEHIPCPSEGGHADFGPQTPEGVELLGFLLEKHAHVSWERVLSGCFGFFNIYSFLRDHKKMTSSPKIEKEIRKNQTNIGPLVFEDAQRGSAISKRCLEMFVSFYGAEAGNLALKSFAVNGIYLAGGVAPKILPFLKSDNFLQAFSNKGRQSEFLKKIPIHVITDSNLPLKGLAHFAKKRLV